MAYDWVKLKYDEHPNKLLCERCGEEVIAPENCRMDTWLEMTKGFSRVHKKCVDSSKQSLTKGDENG